VVARWCFEGVRVWIWGRGTYLILDVLMLRGTNVHRVGLYCFVGGHVDVHVDILDLLGLESIVTAVSEDARLHHVHRGHDACVDCVGEFNVH
jgi:hypothetical protein